MKLIEIKIEPLTLDVYWWAQHIMQKKINEIIEVINTLSYYK